MAKILDKIYDHNVVEEGKYDWWVNEGFFTAGDNSKQPFSIVLPPPNVTGKLHIGHAWDTTIADMVVRRKRMQGYDTLWLPGMDHAGIATQAKIDAKLKEKKGVSRFDIGRDAFMKEAWAWKDEYASFIKNQWKGLGLSLDYTKERFTLDDGMKEAVNYVFISLYNKGYIYQGERIINWDPEAKTALSNIEVVHQDDKGALYYIYYPTVDGKDKLLIATTRPETMFADQALMVNPTDERYINLIGKEVYIPTTNVKIPVISDSYVDKEFGSGIVKVTPAHDPNDFEVGKRHHLAMPLCMNDDGTMNEMAHKYEGMDRFKCREELLKDLDSQGLLDHIEEIVHSVGHSERTGVAVEPRLSKQWFVKMDVLAKQVLENKEYRFIPERYKQVLVRWLNDIQDWCISRQLWWGHRIPAWYKGDEVKVQVECPGDGYVQDEDVLDTWFSSALWPFATMGWPKETETYKRYYPTNLLVTGYDIIFFWVSRMLFEGIEFTGSAPFKDILIHGLIRDNLGRKMSKSLGNGVDPFDVIKKYGCDALRYFLNTNSAPGLDLRYDETKVQSSWNYLNKIWNISRYVMMNTEGKKCSLTNLNLTSKYILTKLNMVIKEVDNYFDKYEFSEGAKVLYNFVWNDFASWYVELAKVDLNGNDEAIKEGVRGTLNYVLLNICKLLHPMIPFITEEIYQLLPHEEESITISKWPTYNKDLDFKDSIKSIDSLINLITSIRNQKTEANKPLHTEINLAIYLKDKNMLDNFMDLESYILHFTRAKTLTYLANEIEAKDNVVVVLNDLIYYIPQSDLIDLVQVKANLIKEKERLEKELNRSNNMLNNPNFLNKAPEIKINAEKEKLNNYKMQYEAILKHLEELN